MLGSSCRLAALFHCTCTALQCDWRLEVLEWHFRNAFAVAAHDASTQVTEWDEPVAVETGEVRRHIWRLCATFWGLVVSGQILRGGHVYDDVRPRVQPKWRDDSR